MWDLIIIGAGPAGITASVYAVRKRMNVLVITKDIGGQAAWSGDIENYTGYQFITGPELAIKFEEHMRKYNIQLKENEEVKEIIRKNNEIFVNTNRSAYQTKTAIIASGKRSKELSVPGEEEFKNRGLTYCATCDGPLFAEKDVAVIGGGNSALDATLQLINIARHIYLINVTAELGGDAVMKDKVTNNAKVSILNNTKVTAIIGDRMVTAIKIKKQNKEETLAVQGIFVEIGLIPNSEFTKELERNENGEIKVNSYNETNIAGIFAAGDVTNIPEKQIIIAAGEGAKAALSAFRYLATHK
ncbi:MAG: FAD-dependent oxidoreductase [Candidatus Omnitrophica bacterium]|nr:FAD-dependent oxidoreductase [Candidatus Omnitrophota bacterium]MDD5352951.1 FAD-dependent oxidoreductase [Candidatus Omnitrophota bacterium]MDD5550550.1 FAD-dependent oxidoreductase [Candidatus Omnitrophota bacterium]